MRAWKRLTLFCCYVVCCFVLAGCWIVETKEFFTPEGAPEYEAIRYGYDQVELRISSSADVLSEIRLPEHELLSQSKSVIALQGEKKKGKKMWFKVVAFDEDELNAQRKYFFIEDERPKRLSFDPYEGFRFECEVVLGKELLDEPYASENARRVAVLKQVLEDFREDIREVGEDNKQLSVSGMMAGQALESVVTKFDVEPKSPALTAKLDDIKGVDFSTLSYSKGKIGMVIECDEIARIKITMGTFTRYFDDEPIEEGPCY